MTFVILFLLAALVSAGITALLLSTSLSRHLLDHPNERSLHHVPTPRIGGIGIFVGMLLAFIAAPLLGVRIQAPSGYLAGGIVIVLVISLIDDIRPLHAATRMLIHFLAAGLLLAEGLSVDTLHVSNLQLELPASLGIVFSLLYVVWLINLYNFMDGIDGLAGGMAVIGFGALALLAAQSGSLTIAVTSIVIAGAALGFLVFNFPPARTFMGDVGASTLGFLAAGVSLWADRTEVVPLWISVLIFSPFIVDATVTLIRRALNREPVWRAHRSHYYQRLVRVGWGHRKTVVAEYVLMIACGASAVVGAGMGSAGQWIVLIFWVLAYGVLILSIHWLEERRGIHESAESN